MFHPNKLFLQKDRVKKLPQGNRNSDDNCRGGTPWPPAAELMLHTRQHERAATECRPYKDPSKTPVTAAGQYGG